ncbi:hypothetical protein L7F22_063953 [Adiantum nelumboides]|nr:hypothetical protein [Adiantum nelumboides]
MASGEGQSNPSTSGDAGGDYNEDYGNEYGPPLPTQEELREMEHRRLVGEATNMMLNFAKDLKLAKYRTETAFQDVHAHWKATTTSPPKPDSKKQYSEKELEEEVEARLAWILGAQDKGKKHDKKRKKSTDFSGYLGSQSTFDKAKQHRKHAEVPCSSSSSSSSSSSGSSSDSSKEDTKSKKRNKKQQHKKGKKKMRMSKYRRVDYSCNEDTSTDSSDSEDGYFYANKKNFYKANQYDFWKTSKKVRVIEGDYNVFMRGTISDLECPSLLQLPTGGFYALNQEDFGLEEMQHFVFDRGWSPFVDLLKALSNLGLKMIFGEFEHLKNYLKACDNVFEVLQKFVMSDAMYEKCGSWRKTKDAFLGFSKGLAIGEASYVDEYASLWNKEDIVFESTCKVDELEMGFDEQVVKHESDVACKQVEEDVVEVANAIDVDASATHGHMDVCNRHKSAGFDTSLADLEPMGMNFVDKDEDYVSICGMFDKNDAVSEHVQEDVIEDGGVDLSDDAFMEWYVKVQIFDLAHEFVVDSHDTCVAVEDDYVCTYGLFNESILVESFDVKQESICGDSMKIKKEDSVFKKQDEMVDRIPWA